ncbi:MAG: OmpA family protein [Candidatus Cyclobacteriaceae bacterium M3_2C_046]
MKRNFIIVLFVIFWFNALTAHTQELQFSPPEKLPEQINSQSEESMPLFSPDGQQLYFVRSFHAENKGGEKSGQDIWMAQQQPDGKWGPASNHFVYNSFNNNAVAGITPDGDALYLLNAFQFSAESIINIEYTRKKGNAWTIPQKLILKGVRPKGRFCGFYMHPSEKILLISMIGPRSGDKEDLYVCLTDQFGRWNNLIHLGKQINTSGVDFSPFLSQDGKTLFFASNGFVDSKSVDIYASQRLDKSWQHWSTPVRLGGDINSDHFDAYFSMGPDNRACFVSNREGNYTDIYTTTLISNLAPEDIIAEQGREEREKNNLTDQAASASSGQDDINAVPGTEMVFSGKGSAFIYFDLASAKLKQPMQSLLEYIYTNLSQQDNYLLQLKGFADDLGSEAFNKVLSQERADAVKEFLVKMGLPSEKIVAIGEGEVAVENQDEALRSQQRKVELVVLN